MNALLLADGRVHRPFNWVFSLAVTDGGTGNDPTLRLVEWPSLAVYEGDTVNGNMNNGTFVSQSVPGFDPSECQNVSIITSQLLSRDPYIGARVIS
jgi:hypothetical protein